jgi:hypothetical protein
MKNIWKEALRTKILSIQYQGSKLRNEIAAPRLATFACRKMALKAKNYSFQTQPKTPKLSKKWV